MALKELSVSGSPDDSEEDADFGEARFDRACASSRVPDLCAAGDKAGEERFDRVGDAGDCPLAGDPGGEERLEETMLPNSCSRACSSSRVRGSSFSIKAPATAESKPGAFVSVLCMLFSLLRFTRMRRHSMRC